MLTESIKGLLGEHLAGEVETALKGKGKDGRDVDLVIGNDGSFVPADKYNGAEGGRKSAENALKSAAEALKAIGGSGDPAKIAEDVQTAKTALETLQTNHAAELTRIRKDTALRMFLQDKVHDPADVIGALIDKVDVDDDGNLKTDVSKLLEPMKANKPYLFKQSSAGDDGLGLSGAKPAASGGDNKKPAPKNEGPVII